jgi:hypothetical protein
MSLPADVAIRRAVPADAEALSELHVDCWDDAYRGLIPQELLAERRMRIQERIDAGGTPSSRARRCGSPSTTAG